jgi:hypothetical protein
VEAEQRVFRCCNSSEKDSELLADCLKRQKLLILLNIYQQNHFFGLKTVKVVLKQVFARNPANIPEQRAAAHQPEQRLACLYLPRQGQAKWRHFEIKSSEMAQISSQGLSQAQHKHNHTPKQAGRMSFFLAYSLHSLSIKRII